MKSMTINVLFYVEKIIKTWFCVTLVLNKSKVNININGAYLTPEILKLCYVYYSTL